MERLRQKLCFGRCAAALERDGGEAGDDHDADRWVDHARLLRQFDAVHLGHDDVGQQQVEAVFPEQRHRFGTATDRGHIIADAGQGSGEIFAHRRVVFGEEDADHAALYARSF